MGREAAGEGTPPYTRVFKWGCRAASPLAAVAVCGGGKVPGRDKSLPYGLNRRRDVAVSCGPGMPGPYRAVMGKRDVAAGWRAAYMRPLQMPGRLAATIVGGGVRAPRSRGFTQILHNIYFAVVVCFVRIHYNRKRYSENKTENGCVTPDDHF